MSAPFDSAQDLADAPHQASRMRPRDAATLIVVRRQARPAVLMGRRAAGLAFMASKWVFPGGRLERTDFTAPAEGTLSSECLSKLALAPRRARALAMAAVRETFEETGHRLARPAPPRPSPRGWDGFYEAGCAPDLGALRFIARAITPPGRTRRFDARFFMADAADLLGRDRREPSSELEDVAWIPLDEARKLDLPAITRFVLGEIEARLASPARPVPFVRWQGGRHRIEPL